MIKASCGPASTWKLLRVDLTCATSTPSSSPHCQNGPAWDANVVMVCDGNLIPASVSILELPKHSDEAIRGSTLGQATDNTPARQVRRNPDWMAKLQCADLRIADSTGCWTVRPKNFPDDAHATKPISWLAACVLTVIECSMWEWGPLLR